MVFQENHQTYIIFINSILLYYNQLMKKLLLVYLLSRFFIYNSLYLMPYYIHYKSAYLNLL
jgi:hypothetical protein